MGEVPDSTVHVQARELGEWEEVEKERETDGDTNEEGVLR